MFIKVYIWSSVRAFLLQQNSDLSTTHSIAILYYMISYFLKDGYTPIHLALRCGHVEVVEKLISSGADVNVVDKVSVTCNY